MSIEILHDWGRQQAVMVIGDCPFGRSFDEYGDFNAEQVAQCFIAWANRHHPNWRSDPEKSTDAFVVGFKIKFTSGDSTYALQRLVWELEELSHLRYLTVEINGCDVCGKPFLAEEIGDDCSCDDCRLNEAERQADNIVDAAKDPD